MNHWLKKSEYYRQRAAEAWEIAAAKRDLAAKEAMQQLATTYEQLAKTATQNEAGNSI